MFVALAAASVYTTVPNSRTQPAAQFTERLLRRINHTRIHSSAKLRVGKKGGQEKWKWIEGGKKGDGDIRNHQRVALVLASTLIYVICSLLVLASSWYNHDARMEFRTATCRLAIPSFPATERSLCFTMLKSTAILAAARVITER